MSIPLPSTIEYTPAPWIGRRMPSVKISDIDYVVSYDNKNKIAIAHITEARISIVLWDKSSVPSYSKIGDFTDKDVDSRIKELLNFSGGSEEIKKALLALYPSKNNK
jgi:hypothetical protein